MYSPWHVWRWMTFFYPFIIQIKLCRPNVSINASADSVSVGWVNEATRCFKCAQTQKMSYFLHPLTFISFKGVFVKSESVPRLLQYKTRQKQQQLYVIWRQTITKQMWDQVNQRLKCGHKLVKENWLCMKKKHLESLQLWSQTLNWWMSWRCSSYP